MRAELLSLLLIMAESTTKTHRGRSRSRSGSPFLDEELSFEQSGLDDPLRHPKRHDAHSFKLIPWDANVCKVLA